MHGRNELLECFPADALLEAAGWIDSLRILACGPAIAIACGHLAPEMRPGSPISLFQLGPESWIAEGVGEVTKAVRYQFKHGARVIELSATARVLSPEESSGASHIAEAEMRAAA